MLIAASFFTRKDEIWKNDFSAKSKSAAENSPELGKLLEIILIPILTLGIESTPLFIQQLGQRFAVVNQSTYVLMPWWCLVHKFFNIIILRNPSGGH